jgi:uncharacterized protein (TIGR04222 family)
LDSVFDLRGPDFLVFYGVLTAGLILLAVAVRYWVEMGPVPRFKEVDPYLVAYLRGGADETLKLAVLSLLDRGLLKAEGAFLSAEPSDVARVRRPVEKAILEEFNIPTTAYSILQKSGPRQACRAFENELKDKGLLPSSKQIQARVVLGVFVVAILWWVAYTKLQIAASRGKHNISFLFLLALAGPFLLTAILRSRRTALGSRVLADLKILFAGLQHRASEIQPGGATNELALAVGVFGLEVLQWTVFTHVVTLFPAGRGSDSSGSSCGSSCGGGCGGGCGGCGS